MYGDRLRAAREGLGMTQRELGRLVGISASAVGMYEGGRRRPGPAARERLRLFFAERGIELPPPKAGEGEPPGLWEEIRRLSATGCSKQVRPADD